MSENPQIRRLGEKVLVAQNVPVAKLRYRKPQGGHRTNLGICYGQINSDGLQYWQFVRIPFLLFRGIQVKQDRQVVLCIQRQLVFTFS